MTWIVGIDEAGYGPNLGPLVMGSVAVEVTRDPASCLWERLATIVCKAEHVRGRSGRVLIDDSKKVYLGGKGWDRLQLGVLAALAWSGQRSVAGSFREYLEVVSPAVSCEDLASEPWFVGEDRIPEGCGPTDFTDFGIRWGGVHCVAIPAGRFNAILDASDSKAGVTAHGLAGLLRANRSLPGDGPIRFLIDKQGGRHFYGGFLQDVFQDGWVQPITEGPRSSRYVVRNLERPIEVRFEPGGDGNHLAVALASMACKYLREVCMRQFNRFWAGLVPGLRPTAGYPVDAGRFFGQIREAMGAVGLHADQVWRKK